jgi:hypothetical protein
MTQAAGDPPRQPFREPPSRRRRGGQILRMSLAWIRLCAIDIQKWLNACCTELHTFATKPSMPKHAVPTATAYADNTGLAEDGSEPRQTQASCASPASDFLPQSYFLGLSIDLAGAGLVRQHFPFIRTEDRAGIEFLRHDVATLGETSLSRPSPFPIGEAGSSEGELAPGFRRPRDCEAETCIRPGDISPMNQSPPHCG